MAQTARPFRVGYAESSFGRCSVCTKDNNVIRNGELQVVKVHGSDVKIRHWECLSKTMSQDIARIYPTASEIKGYHRLNQWDQEKLDELVSKFRRPPPETDGVNTWVRETSNAAQPPLGSDRASTDFGEHNPDRSNSWPSQSQHQIHSSTSSKPTVAPALGLELNGTVKGPNPTATSSVNPPAQRSKNPPPADLDMFKANVGVAAAKIEVAKAVVKQEHAKRTLLERQIALRAIRRRLKAENTRAPEVASGEEKEAEETAEGEPDIGHADAQVQTEEEVKKPLKVAEELDEEDDELLLADSDIAIAKADIRVAEAEVLWEEAKLKLLQREMGR